MVAEVFFLETFSLLCPTRGRSKRAAEFAESVFLTATYPENIEVLFYVDSDDPELEFYHREIASLRDRLTVANTIEIKQGPQVGVAVATNLLTKMSRFNIFLYSSDDQIYIDQGWDVKLDEEVNKYADQIYCIWFNDAWESENFCTFPIVSRKWVETLGYFLFPFFEHFFTDTWVWMLAKTVNRAIYMPEVLVEHRHWKVGKSEKDETYLRNATTENTSRHARDRAIIDKFERYFLADVELLEKHMDSQ